MPEVTIGDNTYDTYVDLQDCIAYLEASTEASDFLAADSDTQGRCIVSMTRTLDRQVWQGKQTDGYETHAWPRAELFYEDGTPVDPYSVPQAVVDACCEGAAQLAAGASFMDASSTYNYQKILKAGSVMIENFRQTDPSPRFPTVIQELIGFWLGSGNSTPLGSKSSGTKGKTIFNEQYDVSQGF